MFLHGILWLCVHVSTDVLRRQSVRRRVSFLEGVRSAGSDVSRNAAHLLSGGVCVPRWFRAQCTSTEGRPTTQALV